MTDEECVPSGLSRVLSLLVVGTSPPVDYRDQYRFMNISYLDLAIPMSSVLDLEVSTVQCLRGDRQGCIPYTVIHFTSLLSHKSYSLGSPPETSFAIRSSYPIVLVSLRVLDYKRT